MKAKIIAFANQKGGVGKTTTTVTVAVNLALFHRKKVLIVDFDPQGQCAKVLGMNPEAGVYTLLVSPTPPQPAQVIRETGRINLNIIPGDKFTGRAQSIMNSEGYPIDSIRTSLKPVMGMYDLILFDTAPSLGGLQERAIWASDFVIVPTSTQFLSLEGLAEFMRMLSDMQHKGWPGHLLGILPTFHEEGTRESNASSKTLRDTFGNLVFPVIHRATILSSCPAVGLTISEKEPSSRAAEEYRELTTRILKSI